LRSCHGVDVGFFAYVFKSRGYIRALQGTAGFIRDGQDLNFTNFCRVDLPMVPLEEQKEIAEFIGRTTVGIDTAINRLDREIELLGEYRTRLVADVVTGKLDVRAAARELPTKPEAATPTEDLPDEAELEPLTKEAE
jgi:type I restriction enzyme S subunit